MALTRVKTKSFTLVFSPTKGTAPDPFYDPLEYIVEAAHAEGIEVHVWLNPYR